MSAIGNHGATLDLAVEIVFFSIEDRPAVVVDAGLMNEMAGRSS